MFSSTAVRKTVMTFALTGAIAFGATSQASAEPAERWDTISADARCDGSHDRAVVDLCDEYLEEASSVVDEAQEDLLKVRRHLRRAEARLARLSPDASARKQRAVKRKIRALRAEHRDIQTDAADGIADVLDELAVELDDLARKTEHEDFNDTNFDDDNRDLAQEDTYRPSREDRRR